MYPNVYQKGIHVLQTDDMTNYFISVCCSDSKCQILNMKQLTYGGKAPGKNFTFL